MAGINLMDRHTAIAASPHIENQNGSIITTRKALALPAKDITIAIEPVQAGSGDPSPDNMRPISGWTGANVVVSPTTDAQDGTTYPISWETEAGTVYGGTLDVTSGILMLTNKYFVLDGVTEGKKITNASSFNNDTRHKNAVFWANGISPGIEWHYAKDEIPPYLSDKAVSISYNQMYSITQEYFGISTIVDITTDLSAFRVSLPKSMNILTVAQANQWIADIGGMFVVYPLATPQTYQLSPTEVTLLLGDNNIWADTGDVTMKFWSH